MCNRCIPGCNFPGRHLSGTVWLSISRTQESGGGVSFVYQGQARSCSLYITADLLHAWGCNHDNVRRSWCRVRRLWCSGYCSRFQLYDANVRRLYYWFGLYTISVDDGFSWNHERDARRNGGSCRLVACLDGMGISPPRLEFVRLLPTMTGRNMDNRQVYGELGTKE